MIKILYIAEGNFYNDITLEEHNYRVGELGFKFSKQLNINKSERKLIKMAGQVHDIGKYLIPRDILQKPSKLTSEEYEVIKKHVIYSYDIIRVRGYDEYICNAVRYHHENFDGTGYPYKIKGDNIPLASRILKICDVYDALTSDRVYKNKMSKEDAIEEMMKAENTFDPYLLRRFIMLNRL